MEEIIEIDVRNVNKDFYVIDNPKDNASVSMQNVNFTRCMAKTGYGGALYTQAKTLSIKGTSNTFTDCTAQN